jgi:hypothetical protein
MLATIAHQVDNPRPLRYPLEVECPLMLRSSLALAFLSAKPTGRKCLLCLQKLIQRFIRANEERSIRNIVLR